MGLYLVPTDTAWLNDARLRDVLLDNFKAKMEEAVRGLTLTREFSRGTEGIKVSAAGNAILVEITGGKAVAMEKGVAPHQMTYLEGSTVPVETPTGTVFRKVTRLSLLLGKWNNPGFKGRERVKQAIKEAFADSAATVIETKNQLMEDSPPRVRDILGVQ